MKADTYRYMDIHADISLVCIQYSPCICDMDCLISGAYNRAYVSCMCSKYIHIFQSICVLYVLHIHTHISIHMCVVNVSDTCTYALAGSLMEIVKVPNDAFDTF